MCLDVKSSFNIILSFDWVRIGSSVSMLDQKASLKLIQIKRVCVLLEYHQGICKIPKTMNS